ncbi:MAG: hypothetical protein ILA19_04895 [Bacilli bacterium]|nr:hypothetical protein [Bacilli bacterium]
MNKENKKVWYNNPDILTTIILITAIVIIVISQAIAVNSNLSASAMIRNLFNHNLTYIAGIIYFTLLKTSVGRKNFSLINVIYILLYIMVTIASIFTIFQSFGLSAIIGLVLNVIVLCYMIYTFLPETRLWKDLKLNKLPLTEIRNDWFFYIVCVMSGALLLVNLIDVANFSGVVITIFDMAYMILFGRYIFLYKGYIDENKLKKEKKNV